MILVVRIYTIEEIEKPEEKIQASTGSSPSLPELGRVLLSTEPRGYSLRLGTFQRVLLFHGRILS